MLSKDCEKCYDRVPFWVMVYIYMRLGIPGTLMAIVLAFLAAGKIDIRRVYGWIETGIREFGLGQGGLVQSTEDTWSHTMAPVWRRLQCDAQQVMKKNLHPTQL